MRSKSCGRSRFFIRHLILLPGLLTALCSEPSASAAVKTWTGTGGNGNWGTSGNWAPAGAPLNGDDLVFPAGAPFLNNTNTLVGRTFNSISFNGASGGYNLRGNAITLSAGITASHTAGLNDLEIVITLGASQTWGTASAGGTLSVSTNIDLNSTRLTINANTATVTLSGIISGGTGALNKIGAGVLILSGPNANTYTGATTVSAGTLQLSKVLGPAVPGDLTIFSVVTLTLGNQIADAGDVSLETATLDLNNNSDTIGSLTMLGSTVDSGLGTLTLGGNVTIVGSSVSSIINGNLHIGSFTRTFNVGSGTAADELVINANIAGGFSGIFPNLIFAGITKTGTGRMVLSGANTFGGGFIINDGFVRVTSDTAFGSTGGGVVVNAPNSLSLSGVDIGNEALIINVTPPLVSLSASGASSWSGPVTLNSNAQFTCGGTMVFSNAISGAGSLTLFGGTFEFAGTNNNTYAGSTMLPTGTLLLNKTAANAVPHDLEIGQGANPDDSDIVRNLQSFQIIGGVTINCSGLLDLNNTSETISFLDLAAGSVETGTGILTVAPGAVTVASGGSGCTLSRIAGRLDVFSGTRNIFFPVGSLALFAPDLQIDAAVSGSANIVVGGNSGDLFLNASNSFTGTFSVSSSANPGVTVHLGNDFALGSRIAGTTVDGRAGLFIELAANTIHEPLTICGVGPNSNGVIQVTGGATWQTNIVLNCDALINCLPASSFTIDGVISGTGGFTKIGTGVLTLSGISPNTYGGNTIVDAGTLNLNKTGGTAIFHGALTIGDDEGGVNVDVVREITGNQIDVSVPITIFGSGLLDLNNFSDLIGPLTLIGGDITTGTGTATLNGNVTSLGSTNSLSIISGRVQVSGTRTFDITAHTFSPDVRIDAEVLGSGGLIKNGVGELSLNNSNTYAGLTTVNAGFLEVDDSFGLGSTNSGTIVNIGGGLSVRFNSHVGLEPLTLNGNGTLGFGALSSLFGSNSWAGNIVLGTNSTVFVNAATDFLNLSGSISGSGDITKTGPGTLIFSGNTPNTFGDTLVNTGTLLLAKTGGVNAVPHDLYIGDGSGGALADVVRLLGTGEIDLLSAIHITASGLFDLNDFTESFGSIDGVGRIDLGSGLLDVGYNNTNSVYGGLIIGSGRINKRGAGTLVLTANNTYTGPTTVVTGTLVIDGSQPQSAVTVQTSATLGGSGVIGDLNVAGGNVSPEANPLAGGSPTAILTSSNVAFTAAADFFVDLRGPDAGTGYDQLNVRGTNNLGGATLHLAVPPTFAPTEGERLTIINNDGSEAIVGTFAGLPNGSLISAGGLQFRITYGEIFGNDVVLSVTNTALRLAAVAVSSGNLNGAIDPNECNLVNIVISNILGAPVTGISATLIPHTAAVSVTQPFSSYPNIAVASRGTNTIPFQVSTLPGFLCGTNVEFTLVVQTAANGTFTIPFSLPSGSIGATLRFNNNTAVGIPDLGSVDSPVTVSGVTTPIKRVSVSFHITHTADSDLDISLVGPDGTIIDLSSDNGGTASDYGTDCTDSARTLFIDSASAPITSATAPFVGSFRPEQSLSAFNGKFGTDANGTWILRVTDDSGGAVGTIRCWSLFIAGTACTDGGGPCESCPERTVFGSITDQSQVQDGRLTRNLVVNSCDVPKTCPGNTAPGSPRFFDAYTFVNGETNACITVSLSADCNLFNAAYLNSYNPSNVCENYLADGGNSVFGTTNRYSFNVDARTTFVVIVNQIAATDFCDYRLDVQGGSCRPVLGITQTAPNHVLLDWTTAAIGYRLERTNTLFNPPHPLWLPVPGTPVISNSRFQLQDTIIGTNQFYQLRKP